MNFRMILSKNVTFFICNAILPGCSASENGMQSTPTTPTAPVDQAAKCDNMRVTSELMTPINAEEKPITRIKRAGPRIPPPKPSKPHTNAPLTPKNTPASTLTLPESVVENVFAPHVETSSKVRHRLTKIMACS